MSLINVADLTFAYEGSYDNVFENVSFQLDTDWKLGFTGRNGRGKTTFLRLLLSKNSLENSWEYVYGKVYDYTGNISANVNFEYFPYIVEDKCLCTGDIIYIINPDCKIWELKKEFSKLNISHEVLDRSFDTLSLGEQTKILLGVLFTKENSFLLIDEPTNHLDLEARKLVSEYLNTKKGFILVSHDREFLNGCIDHILSINKTNIEVQKGNFDTWYYNKQLSDNFEKEENEKLRKDIKRLNEAAKRTKLWADKAEGSKIGFDPKKDNNRSISTRSYMGEKSRKMQQRRKNIEKHRSEAIKDKSKLLKNIESFESLKLYPLKYHNNTLLYLRGVSAYYGEKCVFDRLSLEVRNEDRIVLRGKNGCGKSTVLKLVLGSEIEYKGEFFVGAGLKISYVSQDTSDLFGTLSGYAKRFEIDESLFKAILRKLDFQRFQFEKKIENLSEGQKKKVLIARSLCEKADLYIWDEPLNYIDVYSRIQIEELLLKFKPTMLFVEHDKTFSDNISTKIIEMW